MPSITFTPNLHRHVGVIDGEAAGGTVREVLDDHFARHPQARGYVLDDQGALRKHMNIFVNGVAIRDRTGLSEAISRDSRIHVMQALSGG